MNGDPEKAALTHFLRAQRAAVLAIVAGLGEDDLRRPVVPSGWTVIGMIEHLAHAERHWFQEVLLGRFEPLPWPENSSPLKTDQATEAVFAFYADECARSDELLAHSPLSRRPVGSHPPPLGEEIVDLRDIVLHLIEETARHAGHLDLARELLDGGTELGPR